MKHKTIKPNSIIPDFDCDLTKDSLPDIYSNKDNGKLNTKRIKEYQKLKQLYNIEEGTIRDIFCKGADWYKTIVEKAKSKSSHGK